MGGLGVIGTLPGLAHAGQGGPSPETAALLGADWDQHRVLDGAKRQRTAPNCVVPHRLVLRFCVCAAQRACPGFVDTRECTDLYLLRRAPIHAGHSPIGDRSVMSVLS